MGKDKSAGPLSLLGGESQRRGPRVSPQEDFLDKILRAEAPTAPHPAIPSGWPDLDDLINRPHKDGWGMCPGLPVGKLSLVRALHEPVRRAFVEAFLQANPCAFVVDFSGALPGDEPGLGKKSLKRTIHRAATLDRQVVWDCSKRSLSDGARLLWLGVRAGRTVLVVDVGSAVPGSDAPGASARVWSMVMPEVKQALSCTGATVVGTDSPQNRSRVGQAWAYYPELLLEVGVQHSAQGTLWARVHKCKVSPAQGLETIIPTGMAFAPLPGASTAPPLDDPLPDDLFDYL